MKSWKTTLCGVLALAGTLVSQYFPELQRYGAFVAAFATGLGLILAQDHTTTNPGQGTGPTGLRALSPVLVGLLGLAVLLGGCSWQRSVLYGADGKPVARSTTGTLFDSSSELARLRITAPSAAFGTNSHSPGGISISGLDQTSSSTGAVQTLRIVVDTAAPVLKAGGL